MVRKIVTLFIFSILVLSLFSLTFISAAEFGYNTIENKNLFFGEIEFDGGWMDGGCSIVDGAIYCQEMYTVNISALNVTKQNLTVLEFLNIDGVLDVSGESYLMGNVGIGTTSPGALLELELQTAFSPSYPVIGLGKGAIHINPEGTQGSTAAITFGSNNAGAIQNDAQAGIYVQGSGAFGNKMYFATSNSFAIGAQARMMIDHDGNVGIGVTSPSVNLDVRSTTGNVAMNLVATNNNDARFVFGEVNENNGGLMTYDGGANIFRVGTVEGGIDTKPILIEKGAAGVGIGAETSGRNVLKLTRLFANYDMFRIEGSTYTSLVTEVGEWHLGGTSPNNMLTVTGDVDISGNVGIGTTTPGQKLHVYDGGFLVNNSGNASLFFVDNVSGNVGIGTGSPDALLEIVAVGAGRKIRFRRLGSNVASGRFEFTGEDGVVDWSIGTNTILTQGLEIASGGSAGDVHMTILDTGNVGIGTTSPVGLLNLNETPGNLATTPTLGFGDGDTGFYEGLDDVLIVSIDGIAKWQFSGGLMGGTNTGQPIFSSSIASATVPTLIPNRGNFNTGIGTAGADILSLIAGGTNGLNVISSGNVGIGTTSPTTKLEINGTGVLLNITNGTSTYPFLFVNGNNGRVGIGTDFPLEQFNVLGDSLFEGNVTIEGEHLIVGVGSISPPEDWSGGSYIGISGSAEEDAALTMGGIFSGFQLWFENGGDDGFIDILGDCDDCDIFFRTKIGGTPINAMTIKGSGNIGIGTITPIGKLNVIGDVNLTGNLTFNSIRGEMWFTDIGINETIIDTQNVYVNFSGFENGQDNGQFLNGFTYVGSSTGTLIAQIAGRYKVSYFMSYGNVGAAQEYTGVLAKNNIPFNQTISHRKIGAGGDVGNAGGVGSVELDVGDFINLQITNVDGTNNIEGHSASVIIEWMGHQQ